MGVKRVSRAIDTIWVAGAFDPRAPVSPGWAKVPPKPILRSGDEEALLGGGAFEHHQGEDMMEWSPGGHGALEPVWDEPEQEVPYQHPVSVDMTGHDLAAVGAHSRAMRTAGGMLDGRDGHYVEYHPTSSTNNYYSFNPRRQDDPEPWNLVSTHWAARNPIQSRHQTFDDAVSRGQRNRVVLDRQADS